MPTYDYLCQACGHGLEIFQSMSEAPKRKCPSCGKARLQRQIGSGAGIIFKGSGFYETDYRSDSYKQGAKGEQPATESKATESKTTESKQSDTSAKKGSKAGGGSNGSSSASKNDSD